jgi:hypothetical protein
MDGGAGSADSSEPVVSSARAGRIRNARTTTRKRVFRRGTLAMGSPSGKWNGNATIPQAEYRNTGISVPDGGEDGEDNIYDWKHAWMFILS